MIAVAKISYDGEVEKVCLEFETQINEVEPTLSIEYTGKLNNQMRGFYCFKRHKTSDPEAATMFEVCY